MIQKITLPKLGQTMEEAVIASLKIAEGDTVSKGQVVCEITTDKATLEVESYVNGTIRKILVAEGETLPVNDTIAVVGDPDEEIPPEALKRGAPKPAAKTEPAATPARTPTGPAPAAPTATPAPAARTVRTAAPVAEAVEIPLETGLVKPGKKRVTPRARALAASLGLPILPIDGSGPEGRVHEADVRAYHEEVKSLRLTPAAREIVRERNVDLRVFLGRNGGRVTKEMAAAAPGARGGKPEPLNAMRATIARRLSTSMQTAPHFYLTTVVDMTNAVQYRQDLRKENLRASYNDMILKAVALACRKFPRVASAYTPEGYLPRDHVNVGFAVALGEEGLIVPVLRDADRMPLDALAAAAKELVAKARSNKLTQDEYTGGVITVSNLGMYEVDEFTAIINPGESAILAVGKMKEQPAVVEGEVVARPLMKITLSSDHRTVDGVLAAKFTGHVKSLLEAPERLR